MELREEAWSPGPLDSEDQQMASHENPGEVALGGCKLTLRPPSGPGLPLPRLWLWGLGYCESASPWLGLCGPWRVSDSPSSSLSLGVLGAAFPLPLSPSVTAWPLASPASWALPCFKVAPRFSWAGN